MAIYSLRNPSFSSQLGAGFGAGLGSGLQSLAETKLNQLAQRNRSTDLARTLTGMGLEPAEATFIAQLPADQQLRGLLALRDARQKQEAQVQPQQQFEQPEMAQAQQSGLVDMLQQNPVEQSPLLKQEINPSNLLKPNNLGLNHGQLQQKGGELSQPQYEVPEILRQAASLVEPQEKPSIVRAKPTKTAPKTSVYKPEELEASKEQEKPKQKSIQRMHEERLAPDQKYFDSILAEDKAAKGNDLRLKRMNKLIDEGKLPTPAFHSFVEGIRGNLGVAHVPWIGGLLSSIFSIVTGPIGGVLRALETTGSPGTEEFEKLSTDFVKDAKAYFGNRLTDADLKAFMQTVPTLAQTAAGKKSLIRNMSIINEMAHVRAKTMKDIIKEEGHRPADIAILVEERAKPELDALSAEFIAPSKDVLEELKEVGITPQGFLDLTTDEGRRKAGLPWWAIASERKKSGLPF